MKVLAIAFDLQLIEVLQQAVRSDLLHILRDEDQFFSEFEKYSEIEFCAMVCEVKTTSFANEVAQVMRNQCPSMPSFACALDKQHFEPKFLKKNGFTDAFLFPFDKQSFLESLAIAVSSEALSKRVMKRVLTPDFQAKTKPAFTTYVHLPVNKKHLVFAPKNEEISEKKVEKLKAHQVGALFIDQKDSGAFFEYVATQMKRADNTLSETERQEKMKDTVRQIFHEVFDHKAEDSFESGRELLDSCRKMVSAYINDGSSKVDFHTQLLRNVGSSGLDYNHSSDVSTIAALFGMALGVKNVEELAIAGFLHDLGLAEFPEEHGFDLNPDWNEDLKKLFIEHPSTSLNLLKSKKMIISADVEKMIAQHHEKFNGKGFPKALVGDRIFLGAQILSLADQFHYLTVSQPGQKKSEPLKAIEKIASNGSISPSIIRDIQNALIKKEAA